MSFLAKFKDATIGFSGYPRLARDRSGGFGYMALLLLLVIAIAGVIAYVQTKREVPEMQAALAAAPDFTLRDGQFSFAGKMPYRIEGSEGGPTVIIDTTGQTKPEALLGEGYNSVLVTRDTLYHQKGATIEPVPLAGLPVTLTKDDIISMIGALPGLVAAAHFIMYVAQLAFKALDGLILALVGLIYGSVTGRKVPFDLSFKLGLYAMTLPTIIQWIWPGFSTFSWAGFLIWWGLSAMYLIMGLRAYFAEGDGPPVLES